MPAIPPEAMTAAQRDAAAEISNGPRGGVVGPFAAALRSPECMRRLQLFGAYLRYDSHIPARLREIAILLTAHRWRQDYEWLTHEPLARAAGVPEATIDAIRTGAVPPSLSGDEAVIFELCAGRAPHGDAPLLEIARRVCERDAPPLALLAPQVPAAFAAIIDRALARDPASRPASGDELRDALEGAAT